MFFFTYTIPKVGDSIFLHLQNFPASTNGQATVSTRCLPEYFPTDFRNQQMVLNTPIGL